MFADLRNCSVTIQIGILVAILDLILADKTWKLNHRNSSLTSNPNLWLSAAGALNHFSNTTGYFVKFPSTKWFDFKGNQNSSQSCFTPENSFFLWYETSSKNLLSWRGRVGIGIVLGGRRFSHSQPQHSPTHWDGELKRLKWHEIQLELCGLIIFDFKKAESLHIFNPLWCCNETKLETSSLANELSVQPHAISGDISISYMNSKDTERLELQPVLTLSALLPSLLDMWHVSVDSGWGYRLFSSACSLLGDVSFHLVLDSNS